MHNKAIIGLATALLAVAGCENTKPASGPTERAYKDNIIRQRVQTVTATVAAIDQNTREVTLRDEEGKTIAFKAGMEVRNLPQVKVGDKVKVNFYEATSGRLLRPGEAPMAEPQVETMTVRAPEGEMPGAAVRKKVTRTATIAAVDAAASTVTLRETNGSLTTVRLEDKAKLHEIKVGDQVAISYVEGVAISVEPAE